MAFNESFLCNNILSIIQEDLSEILKILNNNKKNLTKNQKNIVESIFSGKIPDKWIISGFLIKENKMLEFLNIILIKFEYINEMILTNFKNIGKKYNYSLKIIIIFFLIRKNFRLFKII